MFILSSKAVFKNRKDAREKNKKYNNYVNGH
jgi:hypothetical protein